MPRPDVPEPVSRLKNSIATRSFRANLQMGRDYDLGSSSGGESGDDFDDLQDFGEFEDEQPVKDGNRKPKKKILADEEEGKHPSGVLIRFGHSEH